MKLKETELFKIWGSNFIMNTSPGSTFYNDSKHKIPKFSIYSSKDYFDERLLNYWILNWVKMIIY